MNWTQARFFHSILVPPGLSRVGGFFRSWPGSIDFSLSADALWRFGIRKAVAPQNSKGSAAGKH